MSVSNLQSVNGPIRVPGPLIENGQARNAHDLTKAIRTGDLEGAKQAYKNIVKDAPEGATWPKDSAFAELGKALAKGDIAGAKAIMIDAVKAARGVTTQPAPDLETQGGGDAATTAASGSVGTNLNVVA